MMPDFSLLQLTLIGLLFVWTGFVRTSFALASRSHVYLFYPEREAV